MTVMEWVLWIILATLYLICLFTVCVVTFRKGYAVLGILGSFVPFLWLLDAVLPAKPGSQYDRETNQLPAATA